MPRIHLETFIRAPLELCFDLSRSVDVHMASTDHTGERAIGGVTSGMMNLGDEVTWEARHFGVRQRLTSRITAMERPRMFVDEMQRGAFKSWHHTHLFEPREDGTLMIDDALYSSPLGPLGRVIDRLFLEKYMTRLLLVRNAHIKKVAEAQC
ncbi:MAG TPA: SRPBCC family protein [Pyrinomonadaceae bacterium]|jgi:ligand-binding SRPBCC domain-containing protein|nr:SRPBCC family protein [Pyrinomonadaceae bacterium]